METITLETYELFCASETGLMRAYQSASMNSREKFSRKKSWMDNLRGHILGALGEMAVAKYLKTYYTGTFNTWKGSADIVFDSVNIEVRTRSEHKSDLIIRKDDNPKSIFVLVTIEGDEIFLHGWVKGSMGMKDEFEQEDRGYGLTYFVPKGRLLEMNTLPLIVSKAEVSA